MFRNAVRTELLRSGILEGRVRMPHRAIVESVTAVTRPMADGLPLLPREAALREAEELLIQSPVLYPNAAVVRTALRAAAACRLTWCDTHLWAYAEHYALRELICEDFQHGRLYGSV